MLAAGEGAFHGSMTGLARHHSLMQQSLFPSIRETCGAAPMLALRCVDRLPQSGRQRRLSRVEPSAFHRFLPRERWCAAPRHAAGMPFT
jgi:hypothetical protein